MRKTVRKFKETVEIRSSVINRLRSHRYFPIAVLVTVFLMASVIHVWQRVHVLETVKQVSHLRAENAQLVDATSKLNVRLATLTAAGRIEKYAMDSLGLQPVAADQIYTLIGREEKPPEPDELATMFRAIERVTQYVPVVTENRASAGDLRQLRPASLNGEEGDR